MAATTRWVQFSTTASGAYYKGDAANNYQGTKGYEYAKSSIGAGGGVEPSISIGATTNRLYLSIDGTPVTSTYLTLYSGANLDPRFVARNITELLHQESAEEFKAAVCKFENVSVDGSGGSVAPGNAFKIYSGSLGTSSSVTVASGTNTAHVNLGFTDSYQSGGAADGNTNYLGVMAVSGTYNGFFDETYRVVVSTRTDNGIGTPSKGGSNTYTGTMTTGGVFNATTRTYVLAIDVTNGTTQGGGTGNVPTLTWTSTSSDDSDTSTELLYPDTWMSIGTEGLMVKFSDAVFNTINPAWTIVCTAHSEASPGNANAPVGQARYIWGSDRGDDSAGPIVTSSGGYTRLGSRGIYLNYTASGTLGAGYEFYVTCTPPQPQSYDITGVNYGNVTVSTESDVKAVMFEIISGAAEMSTVKFGLQNDGSFSHHDAGNADTYFRFGTVGAGNPAGTGDVDGLEWRVNVVADDIDSDTPPSYLYDTTADLAVVSTADQSEAIGNYGLVADPVFVNIRLGAAETGSNSQINMRLYFDYS